MMTKYLLLTFALILQVCHACGQKHVVANPKENLMYYGIPNPLEVLVEGYMCKDLVVTIDNGKIEKQQDACAYQVEPAAVGKCKVTITSKKNPGKVLGITVFRVKNIPDPVPIVGGKSGGDMRKNELRVQVGITAALMNFDINAHYKVTSYKTVILRDSKIIFSHYCVDPRFPEEVKQAFEKLQAYDKVLFTEINCKLPDHTTAALKSIEFRIVE